MRDVPGGRSGPRWAIGLFALAVCLRAIHLATVAGSVQFTHLGLDLLAYDEWGARIAAGEWLGSGVFYQDPLYPYFLGALYAIAGRHHVIVSAIQLLLASLSVPMLFFATDRWLGRRAAIAAGILAATYLPAVYYDVLILKTWMEALLAAAALWSLARALDRGGARSWVTTGLLLGAGCLVRANLLLLVVAICAWLLLDRSALTETRARGTAVAAALALALGAAAPVVVTAVRNRVAGGEWVLTTAQGGQNFYLGNNATARSGEYDPLPFVRSNPKHEEADFRAEAERRTGRPMGPSEVSRFWFGQAFAWIRSDPGAWLRLAWRKLRVFWGAYEVPDNVNYYLFRESAPVLRLPLPGFGLVAPLGLLGAALSLRTRGWPRALLIYVAVYSISVILFFVFARYRLAMVPALLPLAGFALVELGTRAAAAIRDRGAVARAVRAAALGLALLAFVNLPVRGPAHGWAVRAASSVGLPSRPETSAVAHFNIGVLLAEDADLDAAERELRIALSEDPSQAKTCAELGKVLARQGRDREAIEMYRRAVAIEPAQPLYHQVLGVLCRRIGDLPAARSEFREALRLDPTRADSARDLSETTLATDARPARVPPAAAATGPRGK